MQNLRYVGNNLFVEKLSINSSARELGSHLGKVSDVEFSKNGDLMASSGWGGNVIIWDMHNEKEYLSTNAGHRGPINAVQFSNDGKYLYTSGYDGTIRKFDIFNNNSKGIVVSHGWGINVFFIDEAGGATKQVSEFRNMVQRQKVDITIITRQIISCGWIWVYFCSIYD